MQQLEEVVYVSRALAVSLPGGLRRIVDTARMLNRRRDLTGVLAFSGSHFLQVLEGDAPALDALLAALRRDARHDNLRILSRSPIERRRFGDWAMALVASPEVAARIESLTAEVGDSSVPLGDLIARLLAHAAHPHDGATSKFTPF